MSGVQHDVKDRVVSGGSYEQEGIENEAEGAILASRIGLSRTSAVCAYTHLGPRCRWEDALEGVR